MPILKIDRVTKSFGGLMAVSDVSLELNRGEILGLIGPNGAGKTTLFNLICGSFPPDSGEILYDGTNITGRRPNEICRLGLARTFQIAKPFANLDVLENVIIGAFLHTDRPGKAKELAAGVIDFVGLGEYMHAPAGDLTTAHRKRLELAKVLATRPELLLLDEVMAGLTPSESVEMVSLLRKIRDRGTTLLVIEHVMKAVMSLSDRVAVLHHGELIAVDQPKAIASDPIVIEAYLGEEFEIAGN